MSANTNGKSAASPERPLARPLMPRPARHPSQTTTNPAAHQQPERDNPMNLSDNDYLHQRAAVTDAIDQAEIDLFDEGLLDDEEPRDADAVAAFIEGALEATPVASPWPLPKVVFDVPDESTLAGICTHSTNTIHLHPRLTDRWLLLGLIAHWLTPGSAYGPRYCSVLIDLVRGVLGSQAANTLIWAFVERGASWDSPTKADKEHPHDGR